MRGPNLMEATSYIRQHFLQVLRQRSRYSLGWKTVVRRGIAAVSSRLYAIVRRVCKRVQQEALMSMHEMREG